MGFSLHYVQGFGCSSIHSRKPRALLPVRDITWEFIERHITVWHTSTLCMIWYNNSVYLCTIMFNHDMDINIRIHIRIVTIYRVSDWYIDLHFLSCFLHPCCKWLRLHQTWSFISVCNVLYMTCRVGKYLCSPKTLKDMESSDWKSHSLLFLVKKKEQAFFSTWIAQQFT